MGTVKCFFGLHNWLTVNTRDSFGLVESTRTCTKCKKKQVWEYIGSFTCPGYWETVKVEEERIELSHSDL